MHRGDGSYAHAHPREVNRQIANNHVDLPNSARASLNIAAAAAILIALPEPMTPDEHRKCDKLRIFLERVVQQQAESSISRLRALSHGHLSRPGSGTKNVTVKHAQSDAPVRSRQGANRGMRHTINARRRELGWDEPEVSRTSHSRRGE